MIDDTRLPIRLEGVPYERFLSILFNNLQPRNYLEIGTNTGGSLTQIECDVLCIDPEFMITESPLKKRRRNFFFQMSSDDFFAEYDPRVFFPTGIDLAFLDGMHRFEFLLRDFMGVEKACHERSLILMHDCLPQNARMAERSMRLDQSENPATRAWWTGDVWRMLPILKQYRPDLRVQYLDCPPTGLVAVSRLSPSSTALHQAYHHILDEFSKLELPDYGFNTLGSLFPLIETAKIATDQLSAILSVR